MLSELRDDRGLALIFVTHNWPSYGASAIRVYRGKMIESGPADVMDAYTQKLRTRCRYSGGSDGRRLIGKVAL